MAENRLEIANLDAPTSRIAQVHKPILAVADLIWNAVDADGDRVDITRCSVAQNRDGSRARQKRFF